MPMTFIERRVYEVEQLQKSWKASTTTRKLAISTAICTVLLALFGPSLSGSSAAGDSIDGISFPGTLGSQSFVGGGTRAKYGAVKVYAVGLYIDAGRAASSLKPYVGVPANKLAGRADFFKALQTGKCGSPGRTRGLPRLFLPRHALAHVSFADAGLIARCCCSSTARLRQTRFRVR